MEIVVRRDPSLFDATWISGGFLNSHQSLRDFITHLSKVMIILINRHDNFIHPIVTKLRQIFYVLSEVSLENDPFERENILKLSEVVNALVARSLQGELEYTKLLRALSPLNYFQKTWFFCKGALILIDSFDPLRMDIPPQKMLQYYARRIDCILNSKYSRLNKCSN